VCGDVSTLARRDFLMPVIARIGAIAAGGVVKAPLELPQLIDGLQGWISTTKGRFLFGDGSSIPGHGKAVHEARNVPGQTALFSQATPGLRPTWDATTFDVPCIRSDGTQYLTRDTALPAPGLVIVGCAFNGGITGFHALTGARSTGTPGALPMRTRGISTRPIPSTSCAPWWRPPAARPSLMCPRSSARSCW
jgi:hypothetical protein